MITTRVKLILLIILNMAIVLLPAKYIVTFILLVLISGILFYESLRVNYRTIFIYLLGLFAFTILLNYIFSGKDFMTVVPEFVKLFSIISISILLITDINIMELVASITFLRVPTKIAIAFGVGFRYFSLLLYDVRRIQYIQSSKGYGLSFQSFKSKGFKLIISVFLTPLFLSILKRADNIALSVTIQQLEKRINYYKFERLSLYEFFLLLSSLLFLLYCIHLHYQP